MSQAERGLFERIYEKSKIGDPVIIGRTNLQEICAEFEKRLAEAERDAVIGKVVWSFIDRMNDIAPPEDSAEKILSDFVAAVTPKINAALNAPLPESNKNE